MNITKTWWKTLTLESLIGVDEDIPIQDVINKLQTIMDEGFTHVRGESKQCTTIQMNILLFMKLLKI